MSNMRKWGKEAEKNDTYLFSFLLLFMEQNSQATTAGQ